MKIISIKPKLTESASVEISYSFSDKYKQKDILAC